MKKFTKNRQFNSNNQAKIGKTLAVCLFWLLAWQFASIVVGNSLLLPSVPQTLAALGNLLVEPDFYMSASWTIFRCVLSIFISFIFGICFAWLSYKNHMMRSIMTLPVSFFKAVPVMAIVIYVILVVKANWVAVIACFLMCFPIVYTNILEGLDSISRELLEVAKVYEFDSFETIKLVHIPSIMPYFNAAMKIVTGLSWKAVVAAEVLSVPEFSLGHGMISAKYYLETPTLFAYIIVIVALSLALEKIIVMATQKLTIKDYQVGKVSVSATKLVKDAAPQISIDGVCKDYVEKNVFNRFSAKIEAGSRTAVIGPSGSGKTTLARLIAGLEEADAGTVDLDSAKISYLFQEERLFPWLNVYGNMALFVSLNGDATHDAVLQMAKDLELEDVLWKMPEELSGGMKHRVALGRTFLADCNLMILDEPFRGLDEELKKRIVDRLWNKCTAGKTIMVISHNQKDLKLLGIDGSINIE